MKTFQTDATGSVDALEQQNAHLFPAVRPLYDKPLVIDRAQGVWVTDNQGREYLDFFAGVLTTSIGHCHPVVTRRVQETVSLTKEAVEIEAEAA